MDRAAIMVVTLTRRPSKPLKREFTDAEFVAAMYDTYGDDVARKEAYRLMPENGTRKSYGLRERETVKRPRTRKPAKPVNRPFAAAFSRKG